MSGGGGLHGVAQYAPVADVIGEDQDKAGVQGVAFGFGQAIVQGQEFGIEPIGVGDVGLGIQLGHEFILGLGNRGAHGVQNGGLCVAGPAGRDVLIGADQVERGRGAAKVTLGQLGMPGGIKIDDADVDAVEA